MANCGRFRRVVTGWQPRRGLQGRRSFGKRNAGVHSGATGFGRLLAGYSRSPAAYETQTLRGVSLADAGCDCRRVALNLTTNKREVASVITIGGLSSGGGYRQAQSAIKNWEDIEMQDGE
jgi:hypothetical protein